MIKALYRRANEWGADVKNPAAGVRGFHEFARTLPTTG